MKALLRKFSAPVMPAVKAALRHTPIPSTVVGGPKGVHVTAKDWFEKRGAKGAFLRPIDPAFEQERGVPRNYEPELHWRIVEERRSAFPATYLVGIPDGRVWGLHGSVIAPDDRLLYDVSREFGGDGKVHPVFTQFRLPRLREIDGRVATIAAPGGSGYFHWLFDVLPRLGLIERGGIALDQLDYLVVNGGDQPFQREMLARLGFTGRRVIVTANELHVRAKELVVPSLAAFPGNIPRASYDFLRRNFLTTDAVRSPRRIYVSRQGSQIRRVRNADGVLTLLERHGFMEVRLERLSVAEQAAMFAKAEVVFGPHGAGLSNLVFCRPGTRVIECFAPTYVNPCFYSLSSLSELDYSYLIGEGPRPPKGVDPHQVRDDITVPLAGLERLLEGGTVLQPAL